MMTYYKILSDEGKSIHGGDFQWSLPTQRKDGTWKPGKWHKVTGEIKVCENGFHVTTEPLDWYKWGCVCFEAECRGTNDLKGNKTAFREVRLIHPVAHPQWWLDAIAFVDSIKDVPFFKPDGKPLPEWKLFTAPTLKAAWGAVRDAVGGAARGAVGGAARDAAWDAAGAAARDAAWDAACGAAGAAARDAARGAARGAARDAARGAAWDAACGASGDAARDAARGAARDAARGAAWDAVWDASLYTLVVNICSDLNIDQRHIDHVKARWQVWQKGYCLLGDVNGVLYVYAREAGE